MALVELHCDVVTVPIVQQDPIVLCCGDLWQRHFLSHPTPRSSSTGWRAGQTEDPQLKEKCVQNSPPLPPQGKHPPGGAVPGWQPHPTQIPPTAGLARARQGRTDGPAEAWKLCARR